MILCYILLNTIFHSDLIYNILNQLKDERDRDHVVHKKIMRYWLGTLKIPFSTIYFKSKVHLIILGIQN